MGSKQYPEVVMQSDAPKKEEEPVKEENQTQSKAKVEETSEEVKE